jgi:hypothetical protein
MENNAQFDGVLIAGLAIVVPLMLGAAGAVCARFLRRRGKSRLAMLAATLAPAAGFVAGYVAVNHEYWTMPPTQALDWLALLAAPAFAVLLALEWRSAGPRAWLAAQAALFALGIWCMLPPALAEGGAAAARVAALSLLSLALWRWLDAMRGQQRPAMLALGVSAGALAFVVALGGSITIGLGAATLMALLLPAALERTPPRALLAGTVLLYACLAVAAAWYAEMPAWPLALASGGLLSIRLVRASCSLAYGILAAAPLPLAAAAYALWSYLQQSAVY